MHRRTVCAPRSSAYPCDDIFARAAYSKSHDTARSRPTTHVAPCTPGHNDSVEPRQYAIRNSRQGVTADDSTPDARPLATRPLATNQSESGTEPRPSSYAQALTAWSRGDYDATLGVLEGLPTSRQSPETLLLCARALIRLDRLTDARAWLNRSVSGHRTPDNHAIQLMLQRRS